MTTVDIWLIAAVALLVVLAGLFSAAEAAFASLSMNTGLVSPRGRAVVA